MIGGVELFGLALVVQRIGHSPAKGEIEVRFLMGAQFKTWS